jgi:hypothetical protein
MTKKFALMLIQGRGIPEIGKLQAEVAATLFVDGSFEEPEWYRQRSNRQPSDTMGSRVLIFANIGPVMSVLFINYRLHRPR